MNYRVITCILFFVALPIDSLANSACENAVELVNDLNETNVDYIRQSENYFSEMEKHFTKLSSMFRNCSYEACTFDSNSANGATEAAREAAGSRGAAIQLLDVNEAQHRAILAAVMDCLKSK